MRFYKLAELKDLPTLISGHFDDLKIDQPANATTPRQRVWLSRCGLADGAEYDNGVVVEHSIGGIWVDVSSYPAVRTPRRTWKVSQSTLYSMLRYCWEPYQSPGKLELTHAPSSPPDYYNGVLGEWS